jgi:lipoprotein-anchoring transpeptidase ErfK/SrfK
MDRPKVYSGIVGNEFIAQKTKPTKPTIKIENNTPLISGALPAFAGISQSSTSARYIPNLDISNRLLKRLIYSSLLLLAAGLISLSSAPANLYTYINSKFISNQNILNPKTKLPANAVLINSADQDSKISAITKQQITLTISGKQVHPTEKDIAKWIKTANSPAGKTLIAVKSNILEYLNGLASQNSKKPIDQVVMTRQDGSTQVVVDGQDGLGFGDLGNAAGQIAGLLMSTPSIEVDLPSTITKFSTVAAPAGFRWIDVNIAAKHMEMYEGDKVAQTYPVSAGAPESPTPQGHFKIFEKLPVQDMWGYNANGTKYFQPHVRWVSYFSGSNAIHGNYWRPLSWFGNRNSSHGCVSVPDNEAKWVYDWAPVGTPVIVHT